MLRPTAADLATRPIQNRNPWKVGGEWPRSEPVDAPAALLEDSESMTQWSPFGAFNPRPYFGGHDGLGGRLMAVPQAGLYDSSPNPWPNNGQYDRPNVIGIVAAIMRKRHESSAHRGFSTPTKRGDPTALFQAPPPYSVQTRPIPAVGV